MLMLMLISSCEPGFNLILVNIINIMPCFNIAQRESYKLNSKECPGTFVECPGVGKECPGGNYVNNYVSYY
jgi:hypothetical protein